MEKQLKEGDKIRRESYNGVTTLTITSNSKKGDYWYATANDGTQFQITCMDGKCYPTPGRNIPKDTPQYFLIS